MNTSAGGQMAGYLWQAVEACRRALTAPPETIIKIEVEDDLSVASIDGTTLSCEQLKHSEKDHAISEASPIWWQAVDAWMRGRPPANARLRLLITSRLQPESLLASCYQPTGVAPWDALLADMDQRASEAPNKDLAKKGVYHRWIDLKDKRRDLLTRIEIASAQGRLADSNDQLEKALMERSVSPGIVSRVRESFVGAFMGYLTESLNSGGFEVNVKELDAAFLDAYARHANPGKYEFCDISFSEDDIHALQESHHQHLIPQLAAIDRDQPEVVARALENWFRARTKRQDFMDGSPYEIQDLKGHDENLTQYCQTLHEESLPIVDADYAKEVGRKVHATCMKYMSKLGRTDPPLYFTQGSYHEFSNVLRLKWNPGYGEDG